ncbi:hypothetical protein [Flavobacterium sp. XGLA_31]|uniref:hypothetical protein n=1 Tax=Flavobacterium sp. XGLA_31 TaxID=3447666 RepID=UPI003F31DD32
MKHILYLMFLPLVLAPRMTRAQGTAEKDLVGRWTVTEVISTKPNNDTQLKVVAGYKNSTFVFNADHSFELKTADKSIYITMLTRQLVKAQWQWNNSTNEIKIGTPQNNYSILKIQLQRKNSDTLFILEDSGIGLLVRKTE